MNSILSKFHSPLIFTYNLQLLSSSNRASESKVVDSNPIVSTFKKNDLLDEFELSFHECDIAHTNKIKHDIYLKYDVLDLNILLIKYGGAQKL